MTKTIYNCGCWTIKDGASNSDAQYCLKHYSSYVESDSLDTQVTNIEAFAETVQAISNAQGGQTFIPAAIFPL